MCKSNKINLWRKEARNLNLCLFFRQLNILPLIAFLFTASTNAQLPYTQPQFSYDSLLNISYGTAIDYSGNTDTLYLDIYKPVGDSNCLRPIMVLVHGGAFISGSKEDANMAYMSKELAKRGWVVANINYRLGTHKAQNYQMYALCNDNVSQPCAYISDSSEIFRANFRAMQDAKGAIRFMKNRSVNDSTDVTNVFIAGESAGGIIALTAAFTDSVSEKPDDCFSISDASVPDPDLSAFGCIPPSNALQRPDLGSIDGTLFTGVNNANVKGVGSFYGGVLNLDVFGQHTDTPWVYLFHQGSDVVVNYTYGPLLGRISWECFAQTNLCQSYYFYPHAYGGESIRQFFVSQGNQSPVYRADIIANYSYLNNCLSNGHSIDNVQLRLQQMTDLFALRIADSGNDPLSNCLAGGIEDVDLQFNASANPVPACEKVEINLKKIKTPVQYQLYDTYGKCIRSGKLTEAKTIIDIGELQDGFYFINLLAKRKTTIKFLKSCY